MRLPALLIAVAMVFALPAAKAAEAEQWIQLRDGLKARLLNALEHTPDGGGEWEFVVNFTLSDRSVIADHTKVIDVADQLFARVVLLPADTKGFKRASVNLLMSETTTGDTTVQEYEDFNYARRKDAVWLRQAGPEAWKVAQDPNWTLPESKAVQLSSGTIYIDFFAEIFAPNGAKKALGVELHSNTPVLEIPAKYAEIRELWSYLNKDKLKEEGFDFVRLENYGEARRGRFHVRQNVYLNIKRLPSGDWPTLPEAPPNMPVVAGLGADLEDEPTRLAAAGVASAVQLSERRPESDHMPVSVGIASRWIPEPMKINPRDYLAKP